MSVELRNDKNKLDNEISAIATAINDKDDAYLKAVEDEKSDKYLQALRESLVALRAKEVILIGSRDRLQDNIATQSTQGTSSSVCVCVCVCVEQGLARGNFGRGQAFHLSLAPSLVLTSLV